MENTTMAEVENVRVAVRIRPLSKTEIESNIPRITLVDTVNTVVTVKKLSQTEPPKSYKFDHILKEDSSQTDVYCQTTRPVVEKVLQGYNGTILAYGQTGTGKTYTMTGTKEQRGIIPNTFAHIFSHIAKAKEELTFLVHVTYLEIYNESVRDLLAVDSKGTNLEVREHAEFGVFVQDLSGYIVNTLEELENLMDIGDKNRVIGATDVNVASSRSHAIFTITIESNDTCLEDGKQVIRGKLHLVDLAGSERQSKTHATGIRFKEASKINQSLSVLGNVISALVDGRKNHIPYRNSKLTRLLQNSLGGNSKTVMIATVSPSEYDYEETISTLRYANRAKNIQNHTHVNEQPKETLLQNFQNEIVELRKQLENINTDTSLEPNEASTPKKKDRKKKSAKKNIFTNEEDSLIGETAGPELIEDEELNRTRSEQARLESKLELLKNKIIVGGVNLLEKAQNQEFLLEVAASQLEESAKIHDQLEQSLQQKEAERIDIEERYSSLQEEVIGKSKKIKKLTNLVMTLKAELADRQQEFQRDLEGVLDSVRGLTRELQLAKLIIKNYIPNEYEEIITKYIHWNEDIGEFQLKCVAYSGNNMQKRQSDNQETPQMEMKSKKNVYLSYVQTVKKAKRKSSNVPRPTRQH